MGIFGAMTTAISGLQAQSFSLENISGNIANSRTTGFKRVDTSFADLVPDMPPRRELSGSVGAFSRNTNTVQGDVQASQIGTNASIQGEGFFIVRERSGLNGNQPIFSQSNLFTRRGDFEVDRNGYLVNGTGNYLVGYPLNTLTGAVSGPLAPLQISQNNIPALATTAITYNGNLPRTPQTENYDPLIAGSELLFGAPYTGATIAATDETVFLERTLPGQTVTVYDAAGTPIPAQLRWGKTSNAAPETWSLYYLSDTLAAGPAPKWTQISNNVQFTAAGQMLNPATGSLPVTFTVNGVSSGAMNINFGTTGLTQYASADGQTLIVRADQNGYPSGAYIDGSARIADGGRLTLSYTNGQTLAVGQVAVAQFTADNLLKRADGGVFEETIESGPPIFTSGGNEVTGSTTENANVDIADEFSKMIVTQQAYSANTRVVTTAQSMLQDVINIIR
jgi:flagellar hook protein FlgE